MMPTTSPTMIIKSSSTSLEAMSSEPTTATDDLASFLRPSTSPSSSINESLIININQNPTTTSKRYEPTTSSPESVGIQFSSGNGEVAFIDAGVDSDSQTKQSSSPERGGNAGQGIGIGLLIVTPLIILVVISLFEMKRRKRIRRRRNNRRNKTILPMSNANQTQKMSLAKNDRCDSNIKVGSKATSDMKLTLQKPIHVSVTPAANITQHSESNIKNAIDIEDTEVTKADDTVVTASSSDEMISVLVMSGSSNHSQNSLKSIKIAQSATVSNDIDNTTDEMVDVKSASSSKSEGCIRETKSAPDEIILVKTVSSALSSEIEMKDIIAAESGEIIAEERSSSTNNSVRSARGSKRSRSDKSVKEAEKVTFVTATSSDEIVLVESASSSQLSMRSAASSYSEISARMIGVKRKKNEATILPATSGDQSMSSSSRSKPSTWITCVTEKANEAVNNIIAPTDDIVIVESASSSQYSVRSEGSSKQTIVRNNNVTMVFDLLSSLQTYMNCNGDNSTENPQTDLGYII